MKDEGDDGNLGDHDGIVGMLHETVGAFLYQRAAGDAENLGIPVAAQGADDLSLEGKQQEVEDEQREAVTTGRGEEILRNQGEEEQHVQQDDVGVMRPAILHRALAAQPALVAARQQQFAQAQQYQEKEEDCEHHTRLPFHIQQHHLAGEAGTHRHHQPVALFVLLPEAFQDVEHRGAGHVSVFLHHLARGAQPVVAQVERLFVGSQHLLASGVEDEVLYPWQGQGVARQEGGDVLPHVPGNQGGDAGREQHLEAAVGEVPSHDVQRVVVELAFARHEAYLLLRRAFAAVAGDEARSHAVGKEAGADEVALARVVAQEGERAQLHRHQQHHGFGVGLCQRARLGEARHSAAAAQAEHRHAVDVRVQPHAVDDEGVQAGGGKAGGGDEQQVGHFPGVDAGAGQAGVDGLHRVVQRQADVFAVLFFEGVRLHVVLQGLAQVAGFNLGVVEDGEHPPDIGEGGGEHFPREVLHGLLGRPVGKVYVRNGD